MFCSDNKTSPLYTTSLFFGLLEKLWTLPDYRFFAAMLISMSSSAFQTIYTSRVTITTLRGRMKGVHTRIGAIFHESLHIITDCNMIRYIKHTDEMKTQIILCMQSQVELSQPFRKSGPRILSHDCGQPDYFYLAGDFTNFRFLKILLHLTSISLCIVLLFTLNLSGRRYTSPNIFRHFFWSL